MSFSSEQQKAPPTKAGLLRSVPRKRPDGADHSRPLILVKRQRGELVNKGMDIRGRQKMLAGLWDRCPHRDWPNGKRPRPAGRYGMSVRKADVTYLGPCSGHEELLRRRRSLARRWGLPSCSRPGGYYRSRSALGR